MDAVLALLAPRYLFELGLIVFGLLLTGGAGGWWLRGLWRR